jgi:hypothetical protein
MPFGCECGDGECSPELGETCSTCPADCIDDTDCPLCGDGIVDEGEECNEPGLECATGSCVGCRCLPLCGDGVLDFGELCDGGECCNPDCTPIDSPECGGTGAGSDGGKARGKCNIKAQTGGNGMGCGRDFEEECVALDQSSQSSMMLSFALIFLPTLVLLPSLRSRKSRRRKSRS